MKRTVVVLALVLAVVLGCGAGVYAAVALHRHQQTRPAPGDTGSASAKPALFYYADSTIHDGRQQVPVTLSREYDVSSLQRVGSGWLIVQLHSEGGEQEDYYGTFVYPDGRTWDLGPFGLNWAVDSADRILFSPQSWSWARADPASHRISFLDIVDGPGEELPYMQTGDPAEWLQVAGDDVITGWSTPKDGRMVRTETDGFTHTEVGPTGASRPNVSPDGNWMVDNPVRDSQAQCLAGGSLTGNDWWESCDHLRLDHAAPYAPDSKHLLAYDHTSRPREGFGELVVLDARTGRPSWTVASPEGSYDAAWVDGRTISLLAHPDGDDSVSVLYTAGADGAPSKITEIPGTAVLGRA